jgi:muramoyltetrapeptide carboxypeptidase
MAIGRRGFLAGLAGSAAAIPPAEPLLRPPALRRGDTVGLITPATAVTDPDQLAMAARTVEYFDLKLKWGRNVGRRWGYLGGTDAERLDDLHAMFRDPEVKAVFAIRGGYGSAHLLDRIDYPLIRSNPKVFLGYSDITAMHLAIGRQAGLVTFHGPMMLAEFTEYTQTWFRRALFDSKPLGALSNPPESNRLRPAHPWRTIRPGKARGRLAGGNLSLISASMGTPYEIDTRGAILFLEDIGEEPYRIDEMLTQLRLAGKLEQAAGIVFGECANCRPGEFQPKFDSTLSLGEALDSIAGRLAIPVFTGLTAGHTGDQLTLPLGVMTTLDASRGELVVEEPALAAV